MMNDTNNARLSIGSTPANPHPTLGTSQFGNGNCSTATQIPYGQNTYYYQAYPNYEARIATLEGEVKVLREMVAALLAGRGTPGAKVGGKK